MSFYSCLKITVLTTVRCKTWTLDEMIRITHLYPFTHPAVLGWLKKNNSAIDGLTGTESNPVDPSNASSTRIFVTGKDPIRYEGVTLRFNHVLEVMFPCSP